MHQDFAAPVIQQPETPKKRKKNFCFATIPLIFIALLSLYDCIRRIVIITKNPGIGNPIGDILFFSGDFFGFVGAVLLTVLLFAKVYKKISAIPLFMFSAGYLMRFAAQFAWACTNDFYESIADGLLSRLLWIILLFFSFLAFIPVAVYSIIVISKKKSAPKVLWIIPAVLFCILYTPWAICMFIELIDIIFNFYKTDIPLILTYFIEPLFYAAIILFLIWISFPYKKEKSKKTAQVQPVPAVIPVMPPVTPAYEPVVEAKPEEDPERTIDYSYAEKFYPPVQPAEKPKAEEIKPEVKPEIKPAVKPASVSNPDIEQQRNNMQLLKEYKELLDGGVITQEDYEKKKNELLGL